MMYDTVDCMIDRYVIGNNMVDSLRTSAMPYMFMRVFMAEWLGVRDSREMKKHRGSLDISVSFFIIALFRQAVCRLHFAHKYV